MAQEAALVVTMVARLGVVADRANRKRVRVKLVALVAVATMAVAAWVVEKCRPKIARPH